MAKTYTLEDYAELAYEFAIRNPRVIKLLKTTPLTEQIAQELLEYGIDIFVVAEEIEYDADDTTPTGVIYTERISLDELYLNYTHLGESLKNKGSKKIIHSRSKVESLNEEKRIDALSRIKMIKFEVLTQEGLNKLSEIVWREGSKPSNSKNWQYDKFCKKFKEGVKLDELIDGDSLGNNAFFYYDKIIFNEETITAIQTKRYPDRKKLKKYIQLINKWIVPEKYLKLIPQAKIRFNEKNRQSIKKYF